VPEAARSRYKDVLDFDSSSAILKIEWREEGLGFTAHVQPFLSPVYESSKFRKLRQLYACALS